MKKVGDEYWSDWTSFLNSTDPMEMRILWRVVEIVQVMEFGNYGKLIDAERIEGIKTEKRLP